MRTPWQTLHLVAFAVTFTAWTVLLLVPIPGRAVEFVGGSENAFYFGKLLHVGVYTFITLLGGSYRWSRRTRIILLVVLFAHGWVTEFFQQFVGRGASVRDAVIDNVGVGIGLLIGWKWYWRELRRTDIR